MKDRMDFQPETKEKLSASDYARQAVAWSRKKTESIVGAGKKEIYQTLDRNSVAVVGEDEAGRKVFDVQFPHVSARNAEDVVKTTKAAEKIWKKGLHNAVRAGLINEGQAKEIFLESGPHISFQNQAKGVFKTERKRDDQKEGKSTRTAMPFAQIAQRATARVASSKGARLLTVGGVVMLANSACTVPEVAPVARPTEPAVAEAIPVSTASPEAISSFNESAPTPTEVQARPSYQLEDGTQMEKVEQGQFVDLFPGSEVYMSERGDVVIKNKETGLELAGQKVETKYGSFTLLIGRSHYQFLHKECFGEETTLGGYPNFAESSLKEEIVRIISTLIQLKENEVKIRSVNLATYEPQPKDFVAIYTNPGTTYQLADSMPEGLIDPEKIKNIASLQVGYPTLKTPDNTYIYIRMAGAAGYTADWIDADRRLEDRLAKTSMVLVFLQLIHESSITQGTREISSVDSYETVLNSPFVSLFSYPEIDMGMGRALVRLKPPLSGEAIVADLEAVFGSQGVVNIDFEKFK